ncbi:nitrate/nitrite transporter [Ferrovibrio sp.]|uniref:MFS transporter n=1 Tax=Ferrovibrio sp. TaxID=1917215 RepID=UPI001B46A551|nr:MFS transporter [Ferrovibrio sp.]MBP7065645.1 MFS transporter [Ferrovibrio sp.]
MTSPPISPARLLWLLCIAEVLSMAGFSAFPALQPELSALWQLSAAEAGWINGLFFAGYTLAVPFLVAFTDRSDPRRVMLVGLLLAVVGNLGFALAAQGFVSAALFRFIAGAALAGTYMPGLVLLTDHVQGPLQSRSVAFYTSTFGVGSAGSFLVAGELGQLFPWPVAFAVSALLAAAGFVLVFGWLPSRPAERRPLVPVPLRRVLDFRPVLRNGNAMRYVLGYGLHCWELFTVRSWIVAFLDARAAAGAEALWRPTTVAMIVVLVGVPGSILGNELALRVGRVRAIVGVAIITAALAALIGWSSAWPAVLLGSMLVVYKFMIMADSGALTAGAVGAAEPDRRGATMAVHSTIGFLGAFLGPVVFGLTLDGLGGAGEPFAWGIAFTALAAIGMLSPLVLLTLGRR